MAHLVGSSLFESEVSEQGIPDSVREVLVIEWFTFSVAEYVLWHFASFLGKQLVRMPLRFEGLQHGCAHLDVTLTAIGLGVFVFSEHKGFPYPDDAQVKVDVFPFQAVDFAGAHAGEKAHGEVVCVVNSHTGQNSLDVDKGEGFDIGFSLPELFDIEHG